MATYTAKGGIGTDLPDLPRRKAAEQSRIQCSPGRKGPAPSAFVFRFIKRIFGEYFKIRRRAT